MCLGHKVTKKIDGMLGEGENNRLQADETIKYGDFFSSSIVCESGSANSEACLANIRKDRTKRAPL